MTAVKSTVASRLGGYVLRVPKIRNLFLKIIFARLKDTYDRTEHDPQRLAHIYWFGEHLESFIDRLLRERPAAARAIMRFLITWISDMHLRGNAQQAGQTTPCTVVIEPTDRCNLNCPGCYAKSSSDGSDLSYEQMASIIDELIELGVTLVTLSGGEPFLRERADRTISRLALAYPDRGFLVYTNGTMIDDQVAARLGKAGNVFPAISVEGFNYHTDQRRGKGISRQNSTARNLLARHKVMTGFSATVTRLNAESICSDDFIDMRIEEGDLFGWFFLLQPIGRSPRPDLMVTAEQRHMLRETINRWRGENRPIFLGDFWNDGHLSGGCIAGGRYYFHIYANGDISPCVFSPVTCGNIFDIISGRSPYKSLTDFIQRHPVFAAFRLAQAQIDDRNRPCLLIDHPAVFRRICALDGCRPAKNMSEGYLDGPIAKSIDQLAARWAMIADKNQPLQQAIASSIGKR